MSSNRAAADGVVAALREMDRLGPLDEAKVQGFLGLASALDEDPSNASMWRAYWMAEAAVRGTDDNEPDDFAKLIAALSAPVGDTPNA